MLAAPSLPADSAVAAASGKAEKKKALLQSLLAAEAKKKKEEEMLAEEARQVNEQLLSLQQALQKHRVDLSAKDRTEFDALWGMDSNGSIICDDNLSSQGRLPYKLGLWCLGKKRGPSVSTLIRKELHEVARQVKAEIHDLGYPDLSPREKTKRLLFLFQCDLLPGLSGQILSSKGQRDNLTSIRRPVAPWQKAAGYLTVLIVDAAMLFFVFLFALQQSKVRQAAWLRSFLIWLLCEVCFVSTLVVLVVHYCIPCFVVLGDVGHIGQKLQESVSAYHRSLLDRAGGDDNNKERGPEEEEFNSADFLFVSTRVARLYPALAAAKVIGQFRTVWPRRSYQHVSDAAQTYQNNGFKFFVGSFGTILIFTLQSFLYLPEGLQDAVVRGFSAGGVGYLAVLHGQLFDQQPGLAFIPLFAI
eukprot:gene40576-53660_t